MQQFIELLRLYSLRKISAQEFVSRYSFLRNEVLGEYYNHALHPEEVSIQKSYLAGTLDKASFEAQSENIQNQIRSDLKEQGRLEPFTKQYRLLIDEIVFMIERWDDDQETDEDGVLDEEGLSQAISDIWQQLTDQT